MSASADEAASLRRTSLTTTCLASSFPLAFSVSSFSFPVSFPFVVLPPPLGLSLGDSVCVAFIGWSVSSCSPLAGRCLGGTEVNPGLAAGNVRVQLLRTGKRFRSSWNGVSLSPRAQRSL